MDNSTDRSGDSRPASGINGESREERGAEDLLAMRLSAEHLAQLRASSIGDDIILERGYQTIRTLAEANEVLVDCGFSRDARQLRAPSLLIPLHGVSGEIAGYQSRPDHPRVRKNGKAIKYETPKGAHLRLDIHPRFRAQIADPKVDLYVTEGVKKADAAATRRLCCIALLGVWGWRGRNEHGGVTTLADWESVALNGRRVTIVFDSDVMQNSRVQNALVRLKAFLESKGARILLIYLAHGPNDEKTGLDDFFARGGTVDELQSLANEEVRRSARGADVTNGGIGKRERALTDSGNAERFVDLFGGDVRFCHPWSKFLFWADTHWRIDDIGRVLQRSKDVARRILEDAQGLPDGGERDDLISWAVRSESHARRRAMVELLKAEDRIPIRPADLDRDALIFNCANGTLDLRAGKLRPHSRGDMVTKISPVVFDASADAPRWRSFLEEVVPDEAVRLFLKRAVGWSMTGDVSEQVLFFLYGLGSNGKSVFLNILRALFGGDYAIQAASELLLAKQQRSHPTEVADLFKIRVAICTELGAGRVLDEVLVKQLTGGDGVRARRMREDFWEFDPTHHIWIAANHKPIVRSTDYAIWRRIILIPFLVTISKAKQDPHLLEALKLELSGILNWAIGGFLLWRNEGLKPPPQVLDATRNYRDEMDVIGGFLAECCVEAPDTKSYAKELYEAYRRWSSSAGEEPISQRDFGSRLTERGVERRKVHGGVFAYLGLGLKNHGSPS